MASRKSQQKVSSWVVSSFGDFDLSASPPADSNPRKRLREPCGTSRKRQPRQQQQGGSALWVELYSPSMREDLAVHKKKVQEVESWLVESMAGMKGRKFLLLTGPSGCGKSATLRILTREAQLNLLEWINPTTTPYNNTFMDQENTWMPGDTVVPTSQTTQFWEFLMRCSKYNSVCGTTQGGNLVCVEDFPNAILRDPTAFHDMLRKYNRRASSSPAVFIVTDSNRQQGNVKQLFPHDLQQELSIVNIAFNPIASGLLVKALSRVLSLESVCEGLPTPTREALQTLADTSAGDIRSAVNALQFASRKDACDIEGLFAGSAKKERTVRRTKSSTKSQYEKSTKPKFKDSEEEVQAAVGGKDASLFLFRALGKILYCKRNLDQSITEPLPKHMQAQERLPLQEVPESIYDKTSMGATSFSLFLHQNYLAFFPDIESAAQAVHYLSDSDVLGAEWTGRDVLEGYATSLTARGMMYPNKSGTSGGGWRPLTRPQWYATNKDMQRNSYAVKAEHCTHSLTTEELMTVVVPLKTKILKVLSPTIREIGRLLNTQRKVSLDRLGELDVTTTEGEEAEGTTLTLPHELPKLLSDQQGEEDPEEDFMIEDPDEA